MADKVITSLIFSAPMSIPAASDVAQKTIEYAAGHGFTLDAAQINYSRPPDEQIGLASDVGMRSPDA